MRAYATLLFVIVTGCQACGGAVPAERPPTVATTEPAPEPASTPPPRAIDVAICIDDVVVVRMSDDAVVFGPLRGPLQPAPALRGAVQVGIGNHAVCARFSDDTARCVDFEGVALEVPHPTGVTFMTSSYVTQVSTPAGLEVWDRGPSGGITASHALLPVGGRAITPPVLTAFGIGRGWGCGLHDDEVVCWGEDPPALSNQRPDTRGEWGQDYFFEARPLDPPLRGDTLSLLGSGICVEQSDGSRACRGDVSIGPGSIDHCPVSAPCRCAPGERQTMYCEGRSSGPPPDDARWIDGVIAIADGRCVVTSTGAAACFGPSGATPIGDLPALP